MASGMGLDENIVKEFTEMKLRKTHKMMIFKIQGDKIVIDKKIEKGGVEDLKKALPANECRYAVYDADKKIYFILWTMENATVKDRMVYSSSKSALHRALDGVTPVALSAHEPSDLDEISREA